MRTRGDDPGALRAAPPASHFESAETNMSASTTTAHAKHVQMSVYACGACKMLSKKYASHFRSPTPARSARFSGVHSKDLRALFASKYTRAFCALKEGAHLRNRGGRLLGCVSVAPEAEE